MQNQTISAMKAFILASATVLGGCASTGRMVGTDIPTIDNIGKVPALCSARSAAAIGLPFLISLQFPTGSEMDKACIEGFKIAAPFSGKNNDGSYDPWRIISFHNRYTKLVSEISALTPEEPRAKEIQETLNYTALFLGQVSGGRLTPDIVLKLYEHGATNPDQLNPDGSLKPVSPPKPQPRRCNEINGQFICK